MSIFRETPCYRSRGSARAVFGAACTGDSFLQTGMHLLECRFDHALLRDQLRAEGINTMKPFSDFPFLKQTFTEGERWAVSRERAAKLRASSSITQKQFDEFTNNGSIGSHLENLQRKGGFKGFNRPSASSSPRLIRVCKSSTMVADSIFVEAIDD